MASNTAPKTILLRGDAVIREAIASVAVTPGHLARLDANGKIAPHNASQGVASALFVFENEMVGGGIDTPYAIGDSVQYLAAKKGDQVYALVAAGADAIANGTYLDSAGDGTLRLTSHGTGSATAAAAWPVARALEAVNNSSGGSVVRIKVEVL